jgi:preprotein translocase subunit SecB
MKVSPIQLMHLTFRRISVEVDVDHMEPPTTEGFDAREMFDGVVILTEASRTQMDNEDPRGTHYFLTLRVRVDNTPDEANPDQRFSPYKIDVEAGGVFLLSAGAERLGDPEDLVSVNGTSILWGAVREQVANLSARMIVGPALLPSVHFQDLKKDAQTKEAESKDASNTATKSKRARARKS